MRRFSLYLFLVLGLLLTATPASQTAQDYLPRVDFGGRWTLNANGFTFILDMVQQGNRVTGTLVPLNHMGGTSSIEGTSNGREINFSRRSTGNSVQDFHGFSYDYSNGRIMSGLFRHEDQWNYGWYATR